MANFQVNEVTVDELSPELRSRISKIDGLDSLQNGWKTYSSLDELGLTTSVTTQEVFEAMQDKSMLVIGETLSDTPKSVSGSSLRGILILTKRAIQRCDGTFTVIDGDKGSKWTCSYSTSTSPYFSGWKLIPTTSIETNLTLLNGWSLYQNRGNYTVTGKTVTINAIVTGGTGTSNTVIMNGLPAPAQVTPFLCFDMGSGLALHGCIDGGSIKAYYNTPDWTGKTVIITATYNIK